MRSRLQKQTPQGRKQSSRHYSAPDREFRFLQWLVSPFIHSADALRRRILLSQLFQHVKETQSIDHGYALRFDRPDDLEDLDKLIGKLSNYIIFENRKSPQLTFSVVEEPPAKTFWLQVRSIRSDQHDVASTSILPNSALPYLA
jgi:hypothetical protein